MIDNTKHWKIGSVAAIIIEDSIYLINQKETKIISNLLRSTRQGTKINLMDDIELKLDLSFGSYSMSQEKPWEDLIGVRLLVRSKEFPDQSFWYKLVNFYPGHLGRILKQCEFDRDTGQLKDMFSPVVSSSAELIQYTSLCSESMKEYDVYLEETVREMNCEVNKKTKRWIPGHRYDSLAETRYLLCKIPIRRNDSEVFSEIPDTEVWIYTNKLGNDSSISDILNSRIFGENEEDLKIMQAIPSGFVESGEAVKNDINGDFDDYSRNIIKNSRKRLITDRLLKNKQNLYYYLLPYLTIEEANETDKEELLSALREICYRCLYEYWDNDQIWIAYKKIGSNLPMADNIEELYNKVFYLIPDKNLSKISFYTSLFAFFGITDISKVCEEVINSWNPQNFSKDLDTFLNHIDYFRARKLTPIVDLRKQSSLLKSTVTYQTLPEDVLGNGALLHTILEMSNLNTYSKKQDMGVNEYSFMESIINVEDLLDYVIIKFGEIPEDLTNEILRHQFCSIHLMHDC